MRYSSALVDALAAWVTPDDASPFVEGLDDVEVAATNGSMNVVSIQSSRQAKKHPPPKQAMNLTEHKTNMAPKHLLLYNSHLAWSASGKPGAPGSSSSTATALSSISLRKCSNCHSTLHDRRTCPEPLRRKPARKRRKATTAAASKRTAKQRQTKKKAKTKKKTNGKKTPAKRRRASKSGAGAGAGAGAGGSAARTTKRRRSRKQRVIEDDDDDDDTDTDSNSDSDSSEGAAVGGSNHESPSRRRGFVSPATPAQRRKAVRKITVVEPVSKPCTAVPPC